MWDVGMYRGVVEGCWFGKYDVLCWLLFSPCSPQVVMDFFTGCYSETAVCSRTKNVAETSCRVIFLTFH